MRFGYEMWKWDNWLWMLIWQKFLLIYLKIQEYLYKVKVLIKTLSLIFKILQYLNADWFFKLKYSTWGFFYIFILDAWYGPNHTHVFHLFTFCGQLLSLSELRFNRDMEKSDATRKEVPPLHFKFKKSDKYCLPSFKKKYFFRNFLLHGTLLCNFW